jgi:hypothetical protein
VCKLAIEDIAKDIVLRISLFPVFDSEHVLEVCGNFESRLGPEMVGT